jgi:hypothetical protein
MPIIEIGPNSSDKARRGNKQGREPMLKSFVTAVALASAATVALVLILFGSIDGPGEAGASPGNISLLAVDMDVVDDDDGMEDGSGPVTPGTGDCDDGIDNDGNTDIDADDPECVPFLGNSIDAALDLCGPGEPGSGTCTGADTVPDTEATTLGGIQDCAQTTTGGMTQVDIVVQGYPSDHPLVAYDITLNYDPAVVNVTGTVFDTFTGSIPAVAQTLISADPQNTTGYFDVTDSLPDADGTFVMNVIDLAPGPGVTSDENVDGEEVSDGFLARIQLTGQAQGQTDLTLTTGTFFVIDDAGEVPVDNLTVGFLSVDKACVPGPQPTETLLTVEKVVDGGTAVVGDFTLRLDGNPVTSGVANAVSPGVHTVSEDPVEGYTPSFSGACDDNGLVTLNLFESKTCTITNSAPPPPTLTPTPTATAAPTPTPIIFEQGGGTCAGGGTVSTDTEADGATTRDSVETTVTCANAGTVSIVERSITQSPPTGFAFLGQEVIIQAPDGTAANPLQIKFQLDASIIPEGQDQNTIHIFKDAVQVAECSDASGTASPDPCVSKRELLADGDVEITVLTSTASLWNFGVSTQATPTPTPTATPTGTGTPTPTPTPAAGDTPSAPSVGGAAAGPRAAPQTGDGIPVDEGGGGSVLPWLFVGLGVVIAIAATGYVAYSTRGGFAPGRVTTRRRLFR